MAAPLVTSSSVADAASDGDGAVSKMVSHLRVVAAASVGRSSARQSFPHCVESGETRSVTVITALRGRIVVIDPANAGAKTSKRRTPTAGALTSIGFAAK